METKQEKITIEKIISGTFSKKNNFSGKTVAGNVYYHVKEEQMKQLGMDTIDKFQPFYAVCATNEYNRLVTAEDVATEGNLYFGKEDQIGKPYRDAQGNVVTFLRTDATGVFKTYEEADNALNEPTAEQELARIKREHKLAKLRLDNAVELNKVMKEEELTVEGMKVLTGISL